MTDTVIARQPNPGLRAMVSGSLVGLAGKVQNGSKGKATTRTRLQTLMRVILHIAGFALLTQAAFSWSITAGYVMAGISCFAMSTLTTKAPPVPDDE